MSASLLLGGRGAGVGGSPTPSCWLTVHENEASIQIYDRAMGRSAFVEGTDRELSITCITASPHDMHLPTCSQRHRTSRP